MVWQIPESEAPDSATPGTKLKHDFYLKSPPGPGFTHENRYLAARLAVVGELAGLVFEAHRLLHQLMTALLAGLSLSLSLSLSLLLASLELSDTQSL